MDQRQAFVWECAQGWWSMTELCDRYQISRKTGYKWLTRYEAHETLHDRSRRPHGCAHAIEARTVQRIVAFRRRHPRWGPKKLRSELAKADPTVPWPARSTFSLILQRHGLVRRRRRRVPRPTRTNNGLTPMQAPNAVWAIDFKGWFRIASGQPCYPLTVTDGYSRFLLACAPLRAPTGAATRDVLERVFRRYGLPTVIRSDNGEPFAGLGLARLSRLAVWWIRLGIRPELIDLASPQQNGRHERMHRTAAEAITSPPAGTWGAQQQRCRRFRHDYNDRRPHEALGQRYPRELYVPSARPYPARLPPLEYATNWEVRTVSSSGEFVWRTRHIWTSSVLAGERIALEPIADGCWNLRLGPIAIGVFDERCSVVRARNIGAQMTGGGAARPRGLADHG